MKKNFLCSEFIYRSMVPTLLFFLTINLYAISNTKVNNPANGSVFQQGDQVSFLHLQRMEISLYGAVTSLEYLEKVPVLKLLRCHQEITLFT
jgi:hypothetical protein